MRDKIIEVQNYFKQKILSGDFKITQIKEFDLKLIVDDEFTFLIWIGNIPEIPGTCKNSDNLSFMDLGLNDNESKILSEILLPEIQKFRKETLLSQKLKEIEELQNDLKINFKQYNYDNSITNS